MTNSTVPSETQSRLIQGIKGLAGADSPRSTGRIAIRDERGDEIGFFDPVTRQVAEDAEIVARLTRWRQAQMQFFLTQFNATPDRTRTWLNSVVLKDDGRLLWLIRTPDGEAIGNYGICNLRPDAVELDNLIRGEKGGDPRLIYYAEVALLQWLIRTLAVREISLHVFSNNLLAGLLHREIGFRKTRTYRLTREAKGTEVNFIVDTKVSPAPGEAGYSRMEITADEFMNRHDWLKKAYG